jgi:hypothetical protein
MTMREMLTIGGTLAIAFAVGAALAGDVTLLSLFGLDSFSHSFTWE